MYFLLSAAWLVGVSDPSLTTGHGRVRKDHWVSQSNPRKGSMIHSTGRGMAFSQGSCLLIQNPKPLAMDTSLLKLLRQKQSILRTFGTLEFVPNSWHIFL